MIEYATNKASVDDIVGHLFRCDADFVPVLSSRVNVVEYANKLFSNAVRFEAWNEGTLVGLLAVYEVSWFITNASVLRTFRRNGIAAELLKRCVNHARVKGAKTMELRVGSKNFSAIAFYERMGFAIAPEWTRYGAEKHMVAHLTPAGVGLLDGETVDRDQLSAQLNAENNARMRSEFDRNLFDAATRDTPTAKYAYDFDFEVMHPMMIRTFEPWFRLNKQTLELGSFEGAFTSHISSKLLWARHSITCVEASPAACAKFREKHGHHIKLHLSTFERLELFREQFDNIFMTHVLEHVADPVRVLRRVNDEWLALGGRFFLACPNANAASRQIAVKMGLIPSNATVTPDEHEHGHHRTYSLDTLEFEARLAGLKVIARGGIFFKGLANKQLDAAKAAGIIDDAYLEGCYQLGQVYPDLCASIYLICEKVEAK